MNAETDNAVYVTSSSTTTTIDASSPTIALHSGLSGNDGIYVPGSSGGSVTFGGLIVSEIDHGIHVVGNGSGGTNDVSITNLSTAKIFSIENSLMGISSGGNVTITNNGAVTQGASTNTSTAFGTITISSSPSGAGIYTSNSGSGTTTITNTGQVTAEGYGIYSVMSSSGSASISNRGSISSNLAGIYVYGGLAASALNIQNLAGGTIAASNGQAINATWDGAINITNAGTITGYATIGTSSSSSAVHFDNQAGGVFAATNVSNFGGGVFTNAGTVSLVPMASSSAYPSAATFSGLSEFRNAGTISLANGIAGDTFTINGNYVGQNGHLVLDFSTQTSTGDQLVINGNASGSTGIAVANLTSAVPFTTTAPLVTVNGTSSANAFSLASLQNFGTLAPVLSTNTEGGVTTLSLGAVPNSLGMAGPTATVAARSVSYQGGQAVMDRLSELRQQMQSVQSSEPAIPAALQYAGLSQYSALVSKDPIAPKLAPPPPPSNVKPAVWARAFGDYERRGGVGTFTFGGTTFTRDLGYTQSSGGFLAGTDVVISGLSSAGDGLVLGAMAGYTVAAVRLNQGVGRQDFEGGTVGAYATYLRGPFFLDALFKADFLGLDITGRGLRQSTGLQNYNFTSNIGYRVPVTNGIYVEPTAGIEYVATDFNRQSALTAGTVLLQDGEALRVRGGARIGHEAIVANYLRIEPSLTAYAYSVVSESGIGGAFNGVTPVTGLKEEGKVRGELQASLNLFNLKTGVSGFVRADGRFGEDLLAGGGRAGIRYTW